MYGVPCDLDLAFLHCAELIQVCIGARQVQFHFHPVGSISVEGAWELLAKDGSVIDRSQPVPRGEPFQLHRLLGQRIIASEVHVPDWVELRFGEGERLRLFDSSKDFESFSIAPIGVIV